MKRAHLRELESADLADRQSGDEPGHLRRCRSCRATLDEYRWLQGEIATTLTLAADTVPIPAPRWADIRERIQTGRQRLAAKHSLSMAAGVVLMVLSLLAPSSLISTVIAQTLPAHAVRAPSPVVATPRGSAVVAAITPTPLYWDQSTPATPPLVLHPAPENSP